MATHLKHARDVAESNGHAATPSKIDALIAYHEEALDHLQATKRLLFEHAVARKTKTAAKTFKRAAALDTARASTTAKPYKRQTASQITANRKASAKLLASMSLTEPRPLKGAHANGLIRHGYIVKKGDGYVRTSKQFSVAR
jgi:hypothetical protein